MTRLACTKCDARLSKYNPGFMCAACDSRHTTWDEYLAETSIEKQPPGTCKKGHDLAIHGAIFSKGDGSYSRRCLTCRRDRARNHKRITRAARSNA